MHPPSDASCRFFLIRKCQGCHGGWILCRSNGGNRRYRVGMVSDPRSSSSDYTDRENEQVEESGREEQMKATRPDQQTLLEQQQSRSEERASNTGRTKSTSASSKKSGKKGGAPTRCDASKIVSKEKCLRLQGLKISGYSVQVLQQKVVLQDAPQGCAWFNPNKDYGVFVLLIFSLILVEDPNFFTCAVPTTCILSRKKMNISLVFIQWAKREARKRR